MLNKINTSSEDFLKIVDLYYEKENFHLMSEIFKKLTIMYDEIKLDPSLYEKVFKRIHTTMRDCDEITYRIDLDQLKRNLPDYFLLIVKYLQNFSEETFSFLKVVIHLDRILSDTGSNPELLQHNRIKVHFYNSDGIFFIYTGNNLKINTYVEFRAYIKKVSNLKTVNTRVNVHCSLCGLLFVKKVDRIQSNRMYNNYNLNQDKKLHNCQNLEVGTEGSKLWKEYSDPMLVRYLTVDIVSSVKEQEDNLHINTITYRNNQKINQNCNSAYPNLLICLVKENLLSEIVMWETVKICGIVKTRPDENLCQSNNSSNFDNFFEKIIEISQIEKIEESSLASSLNYGADNSLNDLATLSPFFARFGINSEDLQKFQRLSRCGAYLETFLLVNLINPKISSNFDFVNILSLYFLLSHEINLNIHIFDQTKTDALKQSLAPIQNYSDHVVYCGQANEDLVFNKEKEANKNKSEEFMLKFGKVFNSSNKFLVIEDINLNQSLISFLNLNMNNSSFRVNSALNIGEDGDTTVMAQFKSFSSILTTSKLSSIANSGSNTNSGAQNINSLQGYDIVVFYSDKIDSQRDRRKTNQILENQFNIKKRKLSDISNEWTQRSSGVTQMGGISQIGNWADRSQFRTDGVIQCMTEEQLYLLDTQSFSDFYKTIIKEDIEKIRKDNFLNEHSTRSQSLLFKYLSFLNHFITPRITSSCKELITNLSLHLIMSHSDLVSNTEINNLLHFDSQGQSVSRILTRISMILARIQMHEEVTNETVVKAYMFTKEIVQQNFIRCLSQKRDTVNRGKRNKITFVMEKIKQICALHSKRTFSKSEVREACEYANIKDDIDQIVENLNFSGFMIKVSGEEYQLLN